MSGPEMCPLDLQRQHVLCTHQKCPPSATWTVTSETLGGAQQSVSSQAIQEVLGTLACKNHVTTCAKGAKRGTATEPATANCDVSSFTRNFDVKL